jgi:ABC-2 type transport system ATP-binding protein
MTTGAITTNNGLALDLAGVTKTYKGKVKALRGVDMRVGTGEVFGLLGPNGAGKSTLVKILMTVIKPTACSGTFLGKRVGDKSTLARVGYLPEHHRFPGYLKGRQVLEHVGGLAGVPRRERRRRTGELLELVGMSDWAEKKVGGYSKGMRQRIGIAQALVNNPEIVFLDEPSDGVDPVGRRDIRRMIATLKEHGVTIFLNSHLLSELEMVCDRVAILVQGTVRSQGTIDELTADQRYFELELDPLGQLASAAALTETPGLLDGMRHETEGGVLRVYTESAPDVQPILDEARRRGGVVRTLRYVRPTLEDLFMQAVTDPTTGEALKPGAAEGGRRSKGARP